MPEVGELTVSPAMPKVIMWTIPDFLSLPKEDGYFVASPKIWFDESTWRLVFFPYGSRELFGCSILMLSPSAGYFRFSVEWELRVKRSNGGLLKSCGGTLKDLKSDRFEAKSLLVTHEVLRNSCLSTDGSLRLLCTLNRDGHRSEAVSTQTETNPRTEKLIHDLKELLVSQENSDVTIRVRGEEFKVHRSILGARVPVFFSMFHHEMVEKATGLVTIDDCDADTFRTFLHYVYLGTAEDISTKNVFSLHEVSDKYQLDELKAECLEYMKTTLSVDTLCEVISVGLTYEVQELTDMAQKFLSEHLKDIASDEKWLKFQSDNPELSNDLLLEATRLRE